MRYVLSNPKRTYVRTNPVDPMLLSGIASTRTSLLQVRDIIDRLVRAARFSPKDSAFRQTVDALRLEMESIGSTLSLVLKLDEILPLQQRIDALNKSVQPLISQAEEILRREKGRKMDIQLAQLRNEATWKAYNRLLAQAAFGVIGERRSQESYRKKQFFQQEFQLHKNEYLAQIALWHGEYIQQNLNNLPEPGDVSTATGIERMVTQVLEQLKDRSGYTYTETILSPYGTTITRKIQNKSIFSRLADYLRQQFEFAATAPLSISPFESEQGTMVIEGKEGEGLTDIPSNEGSFVDPLIQQYESNILKRVGECRDEISLTKWAGDYIVQSDFFPDALELLGHSIQVPPLKRTGPCGKWALRFQRDVSENDVLFYQAIDVYMRLLTATDKNKIQKGESVQVTRITPAGNFPLTISPLIYDYWICVLQPKILRALDELRAQRSQITRYLLIHTMEFHNPGDMAGRIRDLDGTLVDVYPGYSACLACSKTTGAVVSRGFATKELWADHVHPYIYDSLQKAGLWSRFAKPIMVKKEVLARYGGTLHGHIYTVRKKTQRPTELESSEKVRLPRPEYHLWRYHAEQIAAKRANRIIPIVQCPTCTLMAKVFGLTPNEMQAEVTDAMNQYYITEFEACESRQLNKQAREDKMAIFRTLVNKWPLAVEPRKPTELEIYDYLQDVLSL